MDGQGKPQGEEPVPPAAIRTPRQEVMAELEGGPMTVRELSRALRLSEKEVAAHLEHVAKSLKPPRRLIITPAACHKCGFAFTGRQRVSTPGRCPRCRHEGISPPSFRVERV